MSKKLTQLTAYTAPPLVTDLLGITHDPAGTPVSRKVDFGTLLNSYGHNVLAYGAVGDASATDASGTDDTAAFNNAIAAAVVSSTGSGTVIIPGGRTYRISSTITIPNNVRLIGGNGNLEGSGTPSRLVWGGAQDGIFFDVAIPFNNVTGVLFENIQIMGRNDNTNHPATLIQYRGTLGASGSPDSGCFLKNVWLVGSRSHAITFGGFITNLYIESCRWDGCGGETGGYGIYFPLTGINRLQISGHSTYTSVAGSGGFIFADCESVTTGTPMLILACDSVHVEVGADLAETFASGTNPFDKRGVFRLGVNGLDIGNITHQIFCNNLTIDDDGGIASYCIFQITGTAGTDLQSSRTVNLVVDGGNSLTLGTNDAGTTGQIRVIGGRVPTAERPPLTNAIRTSRFQWGSGLLSSGELVSSWIHGFNNFVDYPVIGSVTTVSGLETTRARKGMRAFVTDATVTTFASIVAGGGSNNVPVYFDGTDWRIG